MLCVLGHGGDELNRRNNTLVLMAMPYEPGAGMQQPQIPMGLASVKDMYNINTILLNQQRTCQGEPTNKRTTKHADMLHDNELGATLVWQRLGRTASATAAPRYAARDGGWHEYAPSGWAGGERNT